ncbi:hypothetical protein ABDK56_05045 [Sphingomonas sp. ASV193]|uniref:hypothetical protein n=1 Tax=Sphingomonas sp. ASV193 TaxID=3144405 RepID=UPI0032E87631
MPRNLAALSAGALVAVLSVVGKLAFLGGDVRPVTDVAVGAIASDLDRQGLTAHLVRAFEGPIVVAGRGPCEMAVRPLKASGDNRDLSERELSGFPRHRYIYEGSLFDRAPKTRPYLAFQLARAANRLGIGVSWSPVLSVADNGRCQPEDLPMKVEAAPFARM